MKIAIWGAGAVGIGLASALAHPNDELQLICRTSAPAEALRVHGLRRSGRFGERHVDAKQLSAVVGADPLPEFAPDWLLICTKAFSSPEIAATLDLLANQALSDTRLLLCQNGWGNEQPFLSFWPEERLYHARIITGFHLRTSQHVEITAHAAPIAIGSLYDAPLVPAEALTQRLNDGGLPAETSDEMRAVLWAKMLYNCALNPLGALTRQPYGALTANKKSRRLVEEVVREMFCVLGAAKIKVAWTDAADYLDTFHRELLPPTAQHESSMLQDLRAGRPTEIEALLGAVERLAEQYKVETPIVSALALLVRSAQNESGA